MPNASRKNKRNRLSQAHLDLQVLRDVGWWHWTATIPLLVLHLTGHGTVSGIPWAIVTAGLLSAAVGGYFFARIRQLKPYPVQVRIAYIAWLAVGLYPNMGWMHWIQLFGTSAMVAVGYCPLIRMLSLLPLNRTERFSLPLVWRAMFVDPCAGGLIAWRADGPAAGACCSIKRPATAFACSVPTPGCGNVATASCTLPESRSKPSLEDTHHATAN